MSVRLCFGDGYIHSGAKLITFAEAAAPPSPANGQTVIYITVKFLITNRPQNGSRGGVTQVCDLHRPP